MTLQMASNGMWKGQSGREEGLGSKRREEGDLV